MFVSTYSYLKIKLGNIVINGNNDITDFYFKRQLKETKEWKWFMPWRGSWDEAKFDEDVINLKKYYNNKGYKDFYIIEKKIYIANNEKHFTLQLDIYEGPKYYLREINWLGNTVFSDTELSDRFSIKSGSRYDKEALEFSINEKVKPLTEANQLGDNC